MATYANILNARVESDLHEDSPTMPYFWRWFINNMFSIGLRNLLDFIKHMNLFHNTIKFTIDWSYSQVNFLNRSFISDDGFVTTYLCYNRMDKHQYLCHSSCHPNAC